MIQIFLKRIFYFIFSVYWYLLLFLFHIFGVPIGILLIVIGRWDIFSKALVTWVYSLFFIGGQRFHIKGSENLAQDLKYLFIMNHGCFFDIHAIMAVKPDITWLSKKEVLNIPLIGAGLKVSGGIAIDRKNFSESMENAYKTVREAKPGFSLGIFPEGTRTRDGKIQKFKRGFVRILRNSDLQLVPVTLNGFYDFKPKNRWTFHPVKKLEVIVHEPIHQDKIIHLSDFEIVQKVQDIIQKDYI